MQTAAPSASPEFSRLITEEKTTLTRLNYLATCDELTGHLNRTRLREELTRRSSRARPPEKRSCAFVVAAIDKLAVINETYGFDCADEVIVTTGQRLARSLRGSDIIGRTAGNKFGIILSECGEREMALVAQRLHAAVHDEVIETRAGSVSATVSLGAVWLPARRHRPARKRCCAPKRRSSAPRRPVAMALPSSPNRRSANPRAAA